MTITFDIEPDQAEALLRFLRSVAQEHIVRTLDTPEFRTAARGAAQGDRQRRMTESTLRLQPSGQWAIQAPDREPVRIVVGEIFSSLRCRASES